MIEDNLENRIGKLKKEVIERIQSQNETLNAKSKNKGEKVLYSIIGISILVGAIVGIIADWKDRTNYKSKSELYQQVDSLKIGSASRKPTLYIDEYNRIERLKTLNSIRIHIDNKYLNIKPFIYHDNGNILQQEEYKGLFKDFVLNPPVNSSLNVDRINFKIDSISAIYDKPKEISANPVLIDKKILSNSISNELRHPEIGHAYQIYDITYYCRGKVGNSNPEAFDFIIGENNGVPIHETLTTSRFDYYYSQEGVIELGEFKVILPLFNRYYQRKIQKIVEEQKQNLLDSHKRN